jgi:hypothetical protein
VEHLLTTPAMIAKHTGIDVRTVGKCLSEMAREGAGIAMIRAGGTNVVLRLAEGCARRPTSAREG